MSLADALATSPAVAAARTALEGGEDIWVVGGALRDAALGREVVDLDLAVAADPEGVARRLARGASGHAFELSGDFATWRVQAREGWHVDVAGLRGPGIEADLGARDFTVNAMALPLIDVMATSPSALIDRHGGLADLEARTLRAVSVRSFDDDPLRLLRAVRLSGTLSLEIESGTRELAQAAAGRAGEPAGERQFAELRLIVAGPDPLRGIGLLDELGLTATVLPELELLRGVIQNPNHHLDVLGHTVEVLARLLEVEQDLPAYVGEQRAGDVAQLLEEPLTDDLTRRDALRFAALTHDLGKPATREAHGHFVTFLGHDREGAVIVREFCSRLRTSRRLADYLAGIALNHLRLGFLVSQRPLPRRTVYEYLRSTDPDSVDVTLLTVADRLSARGPGATASDEMIAGHLELAAEMVGEALQWRRTGPPRSPIAGDELAAELGIEPGPELGRLLAEVEAAVFAGEVSSPEEAVAHARSKVAG